MSRRATSTYMYVRGPIVLHKITADSWPETITYKMFHTLWYISFAVRHVPVPRLIFHAQRITALHRRMSGHYQLTVTIGRSPMTKLLEIIARGACFPQQMSRQTELNRCTDIAEEQVARYLKYSLAFAKLIVGYKLCDTGRARLISRIVCAILYCVWYFWNLV